MELNFLGIGSAFNTKLYNTSAFFVENDMLFLIDCGETAFEQLKAQDFFKDIQEIFVVFTHTHSDHIAGIAKLIEYSDNVLKTPLNIVIPTEDGLYEDILTLLDIFSISKNKCKFLLPSDITNYFTNVDNITFLPTFHAKQLEGKTYSLVFNTSHGSIFYSSDSTDTKYIEQFIKIPFYRMYIDVTLSIPNTHLDLNILEKIVPKNLREKVYCMHFDSDECLNLAKEMGFNIASSCAIDLSDLPLSFGHVIYNDNKLGLSNCNELTFMQLQQNNLLKGINKIFLFIKNTNANSVAGLGSLLTYSHFILKKPIYICNKDIAENMLKLAKIYGVDDSSLVFVNCLVNFYNDFN